MTRKALATIFLVAGSLAICFGQDDTAVQLDAGKPYVYLAFERAEGDLVWLRLRNNSRWGINVRIENEHRIKFSEGTLRMLLQAGSN